MSNYLDFSSAESALHSLEEAYRRKDIEAVLACKDFVAEARLMVKRLGADSQDEQILSQTAGVLELAYRTHTLANWPQFDGVSSTVADLVPYDEGIFIATEVGTLNGRKFHQEIFMSQTELGWRVLTPVPAGMKRKGKPWWRFW